jgi:sn-glycerol 3-phosphate transport system permease protein
VGELLKAILESWGATSLTQAADWNIIMAGTIIAMLPPLIVLFVLQSSLVKGFSMQEEK